MSKDQRPILFDIRATLHKWPSLEAAAGTELFACSSFIFFNPSLTDFHN